MKLLKKKFKKYVGKVYDLEVDSDDHSYVVNNAVVHNSAGGSLIAALLDITRLDPIGFDLLFERFLNKGRAGYFTEAETIEVTLEDGTVKEYFPEQWVNGGSKQAKELKVGDNFVF
mgnify:CR=1 FL=1|jgi:DNA polymerase-3 subunit alpha